MANTGERQRRFVADAAHELRTPLAGIAASLEIAAAHPETVNDGVIKDLTDADRRLIRLVNDLLELAAIYGSAPHATETIDLSGVVTDAVRRPLPPASASTSDTSNTPLSMAWRANSNAP